MPMGSGFHGVSFGGPGGAPPAWLRQLSNERGVYNTDPGAAPTTTVDPLSAAVQQARAGEAARLNSQSGRAATFMSSSQSDAAPPIAPTKTLLGQ